MLPALTLKQNLYRKMKKQPLMDLSFHYDEVGGVVRTESHKCVICRRCTNEILSRDAGRRFTKKMINQRITGSLYPSAGKSEQPWYRSRRLSIFGVVFLVSATVGLIYNYSRPAIYRSSATLLTSAMTAIDRDSNDADIQHVAIQRQILLGHELIAGTLSRLKASTTDKSLLSLTPADLKNLLTVDPVEETNLVEIKAEGVNPKLLPLLINTWIDVYLDARSDEVKRLTGNTARILEDELKALTAKVDSARLESGFFQKSA